MKKNTYIVIITLITIVCVIIGCFRFIFNVGMHFYDFYTNNTSEEYTSGADARNTEGLDAFTSIRVDVDVLDVTVVAGDSYSISYACDKDLVPTYEVKDGTLQVTQNGDDWSPLSFGNDDCEATITVPKDAAIETIDITSDVGDTEISGLTISDIIITADVGDVSLQNVTMKTGNIELDTGDAELDHCSFENLTVSSDVGDVDVDSTEDLSDYAMDLSTDVGDVEINGRNQGQDYSTSGNGSKQLTVDNSTGDVEISY